MPTLQLTSLLPFQRRCFPPPLDRPSASYWFSARVALWQAIGALGLKAGDVVAAPAFCCGSELEPFLHAGMKLQFFSVTPELNPDPESFERTIEGASAALATHYFGFPSDLSAAAAACHKRGVILIEDCAHALYSRTPTGWVGEVGEASVFSLWKTLAIPDGAALLLNRGARATPPAGVRPPAGLVAGRMRHLLIQGFRAGAWPLRWTAALVSSTRGRLRAGKGGGAGDHPSKAKDELIRFRPELVRTGMSDRSFRLVGATDHVQVMERRRRRYREIAEGLKGLPGMQPLFERLPDGACPVFFPVVMENHTPLRHALAAQGIGTKHVWSFFHPQVPWDRFPREHHLKASVLGFPVHQSLSDADVVRLIEAVRRHTRP